MAGNKLNILIVTQVVDENDWLLGFFTKWLKEFASFFKEVFVCALKVGNYDLPENVKIIEIKGRQRFSKINTVKKLYSTVFKLRKEKRIDCIFIHMCPVYAIALLPFKIFSKVPFAIWFTHGKLTLKLRLAHLICDRVVTASRESFPLQSGKVNAVGHGIDTEEFNLKDSYKSTPVFRLLTAGRIVPRKRLELLIESLNLLKKRGQVKFECTVAGDCLLAEHRSYYDNLKKQAEEYRLGNLVKFTGPVLHSEMPMLYKSSDVFINLSDTDSLDKAVLEAMSCGLPVLTSNKSFREVFSSDLKSFFVEKNNPDELVAKIEMLAGKTAEQQTALGVQLRAIVVNNHNLKNCIEKIYKEINGIVVQGNV